ncbi:sensor histidine kinase [Nocardioides sp.]|uniref:sensor histidine kinase n=1 Tax=Nocardioides sp. TaxID=35761 RepID=UPI002D8069F9|nr:histidine kinase [Nocardioides sp.]HET8960572.1 histidine kinase [Nocardioides sp.]
MDWQVTARRAFLGLVALLFVSGQVQVWWVPEPSDVTAAAAVVLLTVPLPWARRRPLPALLVVLGGALLALYADAHLGQAWFAILLAVYALGSWGSARSSAIGMSVVALGTLAVDIPRLQQGAAIDDVVPGWVILAGTWGLGRWLRSRRSEHASLVAHNTALERDREEASRAAVAYERARIARELHDLVAHSMAVIVLQAQASQRVLPDDVEAAQRSLAAIESVGRAGMDELRRLLDVLLVEAEGVDPGARPSLEQLDDLVEQVRSAGLEVTVEVDGTPGPLPPGLDLSAYRIVQEALTNALKHGGRAPTSVRVGYRAETLTIRVSNPAVRAPAAPDSRVGHGLISMRERAALYGGELEAGPGPEGDFVVHATLPLAAR